MDITCLIMVKDEFIYTLLRAKFSSLFFYSVYSEGGTNIFKKKWLDGENEYLNTLLENPKNATVITKIVDEAINYERKSSLKRLGIGVCIGLAIKGIKCSIPESKAFIIKEKCIDSKN